MGEPVWVCCIGGGVAYGETPEALAASLAPEREPGRVWVGFQARHGTVDVGAMLFRDGELVRVVWY